jgi:pimeloyl-ACP methyl ester carboxylesterase
MSRLALAVALVLVPALAIAEKPRWQDLPMPPAMPKAAAQGHVDIPDGAKIYYASYGKTGAADPTVILLHGGLGNADHFSFQIPALADKFRVIAIDSRGQGRSTLSGGKLSYHGMASDVIAVMDALEIERASMVGWSDGGAIALDLGINYPARVDRLFVFGTNYDAAGSKARKGPSSTFAMYAAKCRADFNRMAQNPKAYADTVAALAPVWRDPGSFTRAQIRSIQAPTLVADGDHDEIILLDQIKEMATVIPNGKLVVFKDTSHFALWQDPAAFNQALVEFLSEPATRK